MRNNFVLLLAFIFLLFSMSCARKGRPDGGPIDVTPPVLLMSTPDTFSTNVDTNLNKIELHFDEYVTLRDYMKNVIISPPVDPPPIFSPSGMASKTVRVEFSGELQPETTYTINFGQSIQDNNEGNPLSYFAYIFSTGDFIDSLQIKGKVNNLGEKKMPENVIAALYRIDENYNDSLIFSQKPYYVAKLDSANQFSLNYLRSGSYRLIAFNDEVPNTMLDPTREKFAFHPDIIEAGSEVNYDLNLFELTKPYRAREAVHADYGKINLYFDGKPEKVDIQPLSHDFTTSFVHHKAFSDTATFYFNPSIDSLTERRVRMRFQIEHLGIIDSLPPVIYDTEKYTELKVYGRNLDYVPGKVYEIEANYPLDTLHKEYISIVKDSIDIDFEIQRMKPNKFGLNFPIDFNAQYAIQVLPNAALDYMQRTNDTLNLKFGVKTEREYGNLILNIQNRPESPFWVKLMNAQDRELTSVYGNQARYEFKNLLPGEYYFKLIVDENANGRYDTGDWLNQKQPEHIYIYKENVMVRAFWDIEETWILGSEEEINEVENPPVETERRDMQELSPPRTLNRPQG